MALADSTRDWTCLEPDAELAGRLARRLSDAGLAFRVVRGTTADIPDGDRFDCALYIDVLEHIADDRAELRRVSALLRPGGRLIVLAPAHQFFFSAFDEAVGHWRRIREKICCGRASKAARAASIWIPSAHSPWPPTGWCCGGPCRQRGRSNSGTLLVAASRMIDPVFGYRTGEVCSGDLEEDVGALSHMPSRAIGGRYRDKARGGDIAMRGAVRVNRDQMDALAQMEIQNEPRVVVRRAVVSSGSLLADP